MIAARQVSTRDGADAHKRFFAKDNGGLLKEYLDSAKALEAFLNRPEAKKLNEKTSALKVKWNEVASFAPLHMIKVDFLLEEEATAKKIKEVRVYLNGSRLRRTAFWHHLQFLRVHVTMPCIIVI